MVFQSSPCGLGIFYGMDMDLISNPSGPTDCERPLKLISIVVKFRGSHLTLKGNFQRYVQSNFQNFVFFGTP